jgi:hypothetical protein
MHQGATPFFARPVTTGDPEAFVHGVRPSSVSNLSAHLPRDAMRSRTSPLPLNADELGRRSLTWGVGRRPKLHGMQEVTGLDRPCCARLADMTPASYA